MEVLRFTADWCGPCKVMQPVVDWARNEGYTIHDKNIGHEESAQLAATMNVSSVPTFILINGEKEIRRRSGPMNKNELLEFINAQDN